MHDQTSHEPEPADGSGQKAAADVVREVMAWYTREILAEHRSPSPDRERLENLITRQRECARDQARLEEAEEEEAARITALYAARLKTLETTGP